MPRGKALLKQIRIYTLTNPENGLIFYVGRTTMALHRRLTHHNYITHNSICNPGLQNYLFELKERGLVPIIEEIDTCPHRDRRLFEEYWIQQICAWGFVLTNVKHYRNKNWSPSPAHRVFSCEELGLFDRLYRRGDIEDIAGRAHTSGMTVKKYFGKVAVPDYLVDPIRSFYLKRAAEISDWYNRNKQPA